MTENEIENIQEVVGKAYEVAVQSILESKPKQDILKLLSAYNLPQNVCLKIYRKAWWDVSKHAIYSLPKALFIVLLPFILINSCLYYFQNYTDEKFLQRMKNEKNSIEIEQERINKLEESISKTERIYTRITALKQEIEAGRSENTIEFLGLIEMNRNAIGSLSEDINSYNSAIASLSSRITEYNKEIKSKRQHIYLIPVPKFKR